MIRQVIRGAAVGMLAAYFLGGGAFPALAGEGQVPVEDPPVEEQPVQEPPVEELPIEEPPVEEEYVHVEETDTTIEQCVFDQEFVVVGLAPEDPGGLPLLALGLNMLNEYHCIGNTVEVYN